MKNTPVDVKTLLVSLSDKIILIAASKKQSTAKIRALFQSGVRHFGENYLQELSQKHAEGAYEGATIHFIGALQSRKCKEICMYADVIHTVDRLKIADKLNEACLSLHKTIDIFIQVNLSEEESKAGCLESELEGLIQHITSNCPQLNLIGLMTFPPKGEGRTYYKRLKALSAHFKLQNLSMGTSDDYRDAIEEGATHIRLGSVLFGDRI